MLKCLFSCCHQVFVPLGFLGAARRLGPLVFEGSHASKKALQRFSTDIASALYRVIRDFILQGSGQRVRRPDNISSGMLTVAFSQLHRVFSFQGSASVGFPCQRGVTSSVGWVLRLCHTVPPACSSNVGSALGERKVDSGLSLVFMSFSGEEEGRMASRSRAEPICYQVLGSTLVPLWDLQCPYGSRCRGFPSSHPILSSFVSLGKE